MPRRPKLFPIGEKVRMLTSNELSLFGVDSPDCSDWGWYKRNMPWVFDTEFTVWHSFSNYNIELEPHNGRRNVCIQSVLLIEAKKRTPKRDRCPRLCQKEISNDME